MIANVKARYTNGILMPLEPVDLAEGAEVTVSIEEEQREPVAQGANVLEDMATLAKGLIDRYPDDGRDKPANGSINYKHNLYGHPKKAPECTRAEAGSQDGTRAGLHISP